MKTVNLKSLIEIYEKNREEKFDSTYEKFLGSEIKQSDLIALQGFVNKISNIAPDLTLKDYSYYYISYEIPQIGKEFDLLRITDAKILNIEYKTEYTDKIKLQLEKNYYYLKFLNKEIYSYTYVNNTQKLYKLNANGQLEEASWNDLINIIKIQSTQEKIYIDDLNLKFIPANYLISPFSKTNEFINNEYFLTQRQEEIKQKIDQEISNGKKYFLLSGEAGSGKTLLAYDIAKDYINKGYELGFIHCGQLNKGHTILKESFNWNIVSMKDWKSLFISGQPQIVIIDEFQRIHNKQFEEMIKTYILDSDIILIMCGDGKQILNKNEGKVFENFDNSKNGNIIKYRLNTKIRSNKELANFIRIMLNLGKKTTLKSRLSNNNINITYFSTIQEANEYIATKSDYQYVSYTPSQYYENEYTDLACSNPRNVGNAHQVIGQEFDNVIAILGEQFYYDGNILKDRGMRGIPYSTGKMFFQQITRAIDKIEIVVVNNIDVFNKLIEIFD